MPKNTTGGKHKGRKNGENNATIKNGKLVKSYIEDIQSEGGCGQVYIGRILSREGNGRYTVFFMCKHTGTDTYMPNSVNARVKGSLRGKIRFETGSFVFLHDTELGDSYEIIGMISDSQLQEIRKELDVLEMDDIDPRVLARDVTDTTVLKQPIDVQTGGFVFTDEVEKPEPAPEHLTKPKSKSKRLDIVNEDIDIDTI